MTIDELLERLEDDTETFTAAEVRTIVAWKVDQATRSAMSSAAISDIMATSRKVAADSQAQWATLLAQVSYDTTPTLEVIGEVN